MSGDRMDPSRQFRVAIGETRQLPEQVPKSLRCLHPSLLPVLTSYSVC